MMNRHLWGPQVIDAAWYFFVWEWGASVKDGRGMGVWKETRLCWLPV